MPVHKSVVPNSMFSGLEEINRFSRQDVIADIDDAVKFQQVYGRNELHLGTITWSAVVAKTVTVLKSVTDCRLNVCQMSFGHHVRQHLPKHRRQVTGWDWYVF